MARDCSFLTDLDLGADQVSFGDSDRDNHAGDWGTEEADKVRPDAVVWPESTADVSTVLAAADERRVPVTPFAAGTSLEGNATPVHAGISLDLTRMNDVVEIRPDVEGGKGRVVERLVDRDPGRLPLFVGDDVTDEDGFRAVADPGTGVLVGDRCDTTAAVRVPGPEGVTVLLGWLVERWVQPTGVA